MKRVTPKHIDPHFVHTPLDFRELGVQRALTISKRLACIRKLLDDATPARLIELPDIRQMDDYSCGAAASMAVGRYFGVGPKTLEEWKDALGTNVDQSTKPRSIVVYLTSLGLEVAQKERMTLDELRAAGRAGCPVICPIQEYGDEQGGYEYGHYVTVIGVALGYVFVQDSSADNALEADPSTPGIPLGGSDMGPGRAMIREDTWLSVWHDSDLDGRPYDQFGIIVGPGKTGVPGSQVDTAQVPPGRYSLTQPSTLPAQEATAPATNQPLGQPGPGEQEGEIKRKAEGLSEATGSDGGFVAARRAAIKRLLGRKV